MPNTMPTLNLGCVATRSFQGFTDGVFLRVDVSAGDAHVPVAGQVGQRPRVHAGSSPPRQACMSERVKGNRFQSRSLARLMVRLLQR
jgi:hypothetical protein